MNKEVILLKKIFLNEVESVVKYWDFEKNYPHIPNNFTIGSEKVFWWTCENNHSFQEKIYNFTRKNKFSCNVCNSFGVKKNYISSFWHPTKNETLTPFDISVNSSKDVWWICEKGHEFLKKVTYVSKKENLECPVCSSLVEKNPELSKEWNALKNYPLSPLDVTIGSGKKVWWNCKVCNFEWESTVVSRNAGTGCPSCSGNVLSDKNSFIMNYPQIFKEWHPTKNEHINPEYLSYGSNKKAWWLCEFNHEWETSISNRTSGRGCPDCAKINNAIKRATPNEGESLFDLFPDLMEEWDYEKNNKLDPKKINPGSDKKAWWKAKCGHSWDANINTRAKKEGTKCPFCFGVGSAKKVDSSNSLATLNPILSGEWHYDKNFPLTPEQVSPTMSKKVWWKCPKGTDHEWKASIASRNKGIGCPYCVGQLPSKGYNLKVFNPVLSNQWHPTKNRNITPEMVTPNTHKKAWWLCELGHEWDAEIASRNKGNGCPLCNKGRQTSFPEQVIYFYLKKVFSECENRAILNKNEIDIFIPSLKLGIEYDGYHHKRTETKDNKKGKRIKNMDIKLLRIRMNDLPILDKSSYDWLIIHEIKDYYISLAEVMKKIINLIANNFKIPAEKREYLINDIDVDIMRDSQLIKEAFIDYINKNNITITHSDIAKEWHATKNGLLKAESFTKGSNHMAWWLCPKEHEYQASVYSRTNNKTKGTGCSYCAGKKANLDNCLAKNYPNLAEEWHPNKNGDFTAYDITPGSHKIVRWYSKDCGHEWESSIKNRVSGNGCPKCRYKKAAKSRTKKPEQFQLEFGKISNGEYTLLSEYENVYKKIQVKHNICGHEYDVAPGHFLSGKKCPECAIENTRKRLTKSHPWFLAQVYERVKNEYTVLGKYKKSNEKLLMRHNDCENEYMVSPQKFLQGRRCPKCARKKGKNKKTD